MIAKQGVDGFSTPWWTFTGFNNWKMQYGSIVKHKRSACHRDAKVAEVLFLQGNTISTAFHRQEAIEAERRRKAVVSNRNIMKRIVDATYFSFKARTILQRPPWMLSLTVETFWNYSNLCLNVMQQQKTTLQRLQGCTQRCPNSMEASEVRRVEALNWNF